MGRQLINPMPLSHPTVSKITGHKNINKNLDFVLISVKITVKEANRITKARLTANEAARRQDILGFANREHYLVFQVTY